jgi:hypothetical protein
LFRLKEEKSPKLVPVTKARKLGIRGNTHGDKKLNKPPIKARGNPMLYVKGV